jgi:branched-chain amino acid transport system ATP-binding protein
VGAGEIVALLGRNGAGRSTTLRALMGDVHRRGSIVFRGQPIEKLQPHEIAHRGLGYVPENRDVFGALTVRENMLLGLKSMQRAGRWTLDDMYRLFPHLKEREHTPAGVLSGGEQQLLSICRTLVGDPELIMIDEPTEGLSPAIVLVVAQLLEQIAAQGVSILLVEQKLTIALRLAQRLYVMGHGRVVFEGTPDDLRANATVRRDWLEV